MSRKQSDDLQTKSMGDDELEDFRKQCERNLTRSIADRMRYGFNYVYKPVLDDAA